MYFHCSGQKLKRLDTLLPLMCKCSPGCLQKVRGCVERKDAWRGNCERACGLSSRGPSHYITSLKLMFDCVWVCALCSKGLSHCFMLHLIKTRLTALGPAGWTHKHFLKQTSDWIPPGLLSSPANNAISLSSGRGWGMPNLPQYSLENAFKVCVCRLLI